MAKLLKRLFVVILLLSCVFAGDEYDIYDKSQNNQTLVGSSEVLTVAVNTTANAVISEARLNWNGTDYAGFAETGTSPYNFSRTLTMPDIGTIAANISYYWNFTVSYTNGTTLFDNNTAGNQTIHRVIVTNCTVLTTEKALNMSFYDEENLSSLKAAGQIKVECLRNNYTQTTSWAWTANQSAYSCIYPAWADCVANFTIRYWNSTEYYTRPYDRQAVSLSNTSKAWSLYLLNTSASTNTTISITDIVGQEVQATVEIYRQYLSENVNRLVASAQSDVLGSVLIPLKQKDVQYTVLLTQNGVTIQAFSRVVFSDTTLSLTQFPTEYGQWFSTYTTTMAQCAPVNSSKSIQCNVTDSLGLLTNATFSVTQETGAASSSVCSLYSVSFPANFQCNLGTSENKTYFYSVFGTLTNSQQQLASGWLITPATGYGFIGVFAAFGLILFTFMAGLPSVSTSLVLSCFGVIISVLMGLLPLAPQYVVWYCVAVVAIVWAVKT